MLVVAVDPGGTTGYAMATDGPDGWTWYSSQAPWEQASDAILDAVETAHRTRTPTVIVCERYTITLQTLKKSRQYEALYVIGGLLLIARRYRCELVLQAPSEAKALVTDGKLKQAGWYDATRGHDHARDGVRHLVHYLVSTSKMDARLLLQPRPPCTCETFGNGVVSGNDGRLEPGEGCPRHGV